MDRVAVQVVGEVRGRIRTETKDAEKVPFQIKRDIFSIEKVPFQMIRDIFSVHTFL